jgi:hypothetical protein
MTRFICFIFLAFMTTLSSAQEVVQFTPVVGSPNDYTNQLFQNVDLTQAQTGFLLDKSIAFIEPELYNGKVLSDSTNLDLSKFSLLYGVLRLAKVNNTPFPSYHIFSFFSKKRYAQIGLQTDLFYALI